MKKSILFLFSQIALFTLGFSQTNVSSVISANETWTASKSPYIISSNVVIDKNIVVKIMPGVEVKSSGDFKIIVNGSIQAFGKKDSIITISSLSMEYTALALDYKPKSQTGSQYRYCNVIGFGSSSSVLFKLTKTDLMIDNCNLSNAYYIVDGNYSDSVSVWITNSKIDMSKNSYGYNTYGLYSNSFLSVTNSIILGGNFYMAETNIIENNFMEGTKYYPSLYFQSYTKRATVSCNHFKGGSTAIDLTMIHTKPGKLLIENNQFDSLPLFIKQACTTNYDSLIVRNNNFLRYLTSAVSFISCSSTTGRYKFVNYQSNYWNDTDTNIIKKMIFDFRADIQVNYKVDFDNFLSKSVSPCWPKSKGTQPSSGIQSIGIQPNFMEAYPNPAVYNFTMIARVIPVFTSIYNLSGQKIWTQELHNTTTSVNIESLKPGVYIIQAVTKEGLSQNLKLVVQ